MPSKKFNFAKETTGYSAITELSNIGYAASKESLTEAGTTNIIHINESKNKVNQDKEITSIIISTSLPSTTAKLYSTLTPLITTTPTIYSTPISSTSSLLEKTALSTISSMFGIKNLTTTISTLFVSTTASQSKAISSKTTTLPSIKEKTYSQVTNLTSRRKLTGEETNNTGENITNEYSTDTATTKYVLLNEYKNIIQKVII